jgi:acyl carrier protein
MLRLVAFIEAEFGTSVPPEDFVIDNFRTVEVLGRYLEARSDG